MVEVCTACGRRYFPSLLDEGTHCERCLAQAFEAELAREIRRATEHMPPRRIEPRPPEAHASMPR